MNQDSFQMGTSSDADTVLQGGSKRRKMDCEGTALGNSYRSRKRKEKEAASQAASHKSNLGKRLRRELEMLHDHVPDVSADASGPCASAGKRHKAISGTPVQKTKMRAFTPGKKSSKPKSADWEYMVSMLVICFLLRSTQVMPARIDCLFG